MSISVKTRKLLWGHSGNRCVFCRCILVFDETSTDHKTIIGDECHIHSSKPKGPRQYPTLPSKDYDSYNNLILLCKVHHKVIDDQEDTYTADKLQSMKTKHEQWVLNKLIDDPILKKIRIRRNNADTFLVLEKMTTGKTLFDLTTSCKASSMDNDILKTNEEVELVGDFFQTLFDWTEIAESIEPSERVKVIYNLGKSLKMIEKAGFFLFGGKEYFILEGGIGNPEDFPVAILRIIRQENKDVFTLNKDTYKKILTEIDHLDDKQK